MSDRGAIRLGYHHDVVAGGKRRIIRTQVRAMESDIVQRADAATGNACPAKSTCTTHDRGRNGPSGS